MSPVEAVLLHRGDLSSSACSLPALCVPGADTQRLTHPHVSSSKWKLNFSFSSCPDSMERRDASIHLSDAAAATVLLCLTMNSRRGQQAGSDLTGSITLTTKPALHVEVLQLSPKYPQVAMNPHGSVSSTPFPWCSMVLLGPRSEEPSSKEVMHVWPLLHMK